MRALWLLPLLLAGACAPDAPVPPKHVAQPTDMPRASPVLHAPVTAAPEPAAPDNGSAPPPPVKAAPKTPRPAPQQPAAYRAHGTEPFWAISVSADRLTLEQPGEPPAHFTVTAMGKGATRYITGDGIALTIGPGPCNDGMSDTVYADTVRVATGGNILKGCGGPARTARPEYPQVDE